MSKLFYKKEELPITTFEWGDVVNRLEPKSSGCETFVVMDVTLDPGGMHNFHKHVDQDEIIIVLKGKVEQWVDKNKQILSAGDSAFVPKNTVHASFNIFDEPATLQVVLAPAKGETGYELVDVAEEEPWKSIRYHIHMENNEKELDKTQPDVRKEILDSLEKSISEFDVLYKKLS